MRIFNEDKTIELFEYDENLGYLKADVLVTEIPEQAEVTEVSHYEVTKVYPNGGKDIEKVVDVEGRPYAPARSETEDIYVYVPYTEDELRERSARLDIGELKRRLKDTDYQAIKFAEGMLSEDEYADMRAQRQAWRDRINELEAVLGGGADG